MKALIVYGSKHGSTRRIAEEISHVLTKEGLEVRVADAKEGIGNVEDNDVVIIGSAVQMRSWLGPAKRFMRQNAPVLRSRPVWLFSSGLRGDDPRSVSPRVISEYMITIGPRDHRFFPGSFDPKGMGRLHGALVRLPGVRTMFPVGDFRDWNEIHRWARTIVESQPMEKGAAPAGGMQ